MSIDEVMLPRGSSPESLQRERNPDYFVIVTIYKCPKNMSHAGSQPKDYKTDTLIKCVCCRQMVGNTFLTSGSSQQYEQVIEIIFHL